MSTQDNKRVARELLAASAIHDGAKFEALMHPDATYWVIGQKHLFPVSGEKTRAEICAYMATPSIFTEVSSKIITMTAEDDRVAVESEFAGTLPDGRVYRNVYHYLMWFRDGKVIRLKEYLDTQSAAEFFGGVVPIMTEPKSIPLTSPRA
jgi:uncharacterized protein